MLKSKINDLFETLKNHRSADDGLGSTQNLNNTNINLLMNLLSADKNDTSRITLSGILHQYVRPHRNNTHGNYYINDV